MTERPMEKIGEGLEAEMYAWGKGKILRLMRDPRGQASNNRQAVAMELARASGVRVPKIAGLITVADRPGMIMERVDGRDLMAELGRRPWRLFWVARLSGQVHAHLHGVTASEDLPALLALMRVTIEFSSLVPSEIAGRAMADLQGLPNGDKLCHGDFYPANLLLHPDGPVLIDWSRATRGDPDADVARTLLMVRLGELPPTTPLLVRPIAAIGRGLLAESYVRSYRSHRDLNPDRVDRWMVPVAAARLAEGIEGERLRLLKFLCRPAHVEGAPQIM